MPLRANPGQGYEHYLCTNEGRLYQILAIIDVHTGCVVGGVLSGRLTGQRCTEIVYQAMVQHRKAEDMNSDVNITILNEIEIPIIMG